MRFFRRKAAVITEPIRPDQARLRSGQRPSPMRDGARFAVLDGDEDLEVVGESFYQPSLWQLAGARPGRERVRKEIRAVLVPEDDNPYDPNAVAVWIDGLQVGHLPRENALRYRPGLLAQQHARGVPIALPGVITGGGIRSDGLGRLGVFLRHDPEDFGLARHPLPPPSEPRMRTGLSDARATDAADDSYDLGWMDGLPTITSAPSPTCAACSPKKPTSWTVTTCTCS
jgi:hypothetical protein